MAADGGAAMAAICARSTRFQRIACIRGPKDGESDGVGCQLIPAYLPVACATLPILTDELTANNASMVRRLLAPSVSPPDPSEPREGCRGGTKDALSYSMTARSTTRARATTRGNHRENASSTGRRRFSATNRAIKRRAYAALPLLREDANT